MDAVRSYAKSTQQTIDNALDQLDDEGRKQWQTLLNLEWGRSEGFITKHPKLAKALGSRTLLAMHVNRVPLFMREMSIVYLLIAFQEYLRISLHNILSDKPEILKGSMKNITVKEFFEHKDKGDDAVLDRIIEKEVTGGINQDPEEINKYLTKRFRIDLSGNSDWSEFKEVFYRRHAIIHNRSIADEKYKAKAQRTGPMELTVTREYLVDAVAIFEKYAHLINESFHDKFCASQSKG